MCRRHGLKSPSGSSPFFLLFGTAPTEEVQDYAPYVREPTPAEEAQWAEEMVRMHAAPLGRDYDNSLRAARQQMRAYLGENKAITRTSGTGESNGHNVSDPERAT